MADVASDNVTPWIESKLIVLVSVVPMPPGMNDRAPNKPDTVCAIVAPDQLIEEPKVFNKIKKLNPSSDQAIVPNIVV